MGISKQELERQEELYELGRRICLRAGALEECEHHPGEYFEGDEDVTEAYKLGNAMISREEISEERKILTDAIKNAYEDNYYNIECPVCERN